MGSAQMSTHSQWLIALFSAHRVCRFSLTLIDTLDTLVVRTGSALKVVLVCMMLGSNTEMCVKVLNKLDEFEEAVRKVLKDVRLDNDVVVSVFETNIRVLG